MDFATALLVWMSRFASLLLRRDLKNSSPPSQIGGHMEFFLLILAVLTFLVELPGMIVNLLQIIQEWRRKRQKRKDKLS
jgi:hypothetical protein